jgi:threonine/homoserine/homoserine lactone efflux protein
MPKHGERLLDSADMDAELSFLIYGIAFGLSAAITPGPLLALLVSETVKHGKGAGFKVALAPLFTDSPIILLSVFFLSQVSGITPILGAISLLGALFLAHMAYENLSIKEIRIGMAKGGADSLKKGIITNFLNPHPYIFIFLVEGPIIINALKTSGISALAFVFGFFAFFLGAQAVLALIVDRYRGALGSKAYIYAVKLIGLVMLAFALGFLLEGLKLLGITA